MKCRILKNGNCYITQKYNNNHKGTDIVGYKNNKKITDTVLAHSSGTVIDVKVGEKNNKGSKGMKSYGNYVQIRHSNGYTTFYAHLDKVYVKKGQKVKEKQEIGYMGNTGNSYGAHLHFEVRKDEKYKNTINSDKYLTENILKRKIKYRVYSNTDKRWFNITEDGKTAGNLKSIIGGIQIKVENGGKVKYRSHIKNGNWLSEVTKWDNTDNGYAGIKGKTMDCLSIKVEEGIITYRVHIKNKWLPWVTKYGTSKYDEYAGIYGKEIDGIEIKFK